MRKRKKRSPLPAPGASTPEGLPPGERPAVASIGDIDLSELRAMWKRRAAAAGKTWPLSGHEEAALLRKSQEGKVDMPGWREWLQNRDKPARFYAPPSELRDDVEP